MQREAAVSIFLQGQIARPGAETLVLQRVRQLVDDYRLLKHVAVAHSGDGGGQLVDGEVRVGQRIVKRQHLRFVKREHAAD